MPRRLIDVAPAAYALLRLAEEAVRLVLREARFLRITRVKSNKGRDTPS